MSIFSGISNIKKLHTSGTDAVRPGDAQAGGVIMSITNIYVTMTNDTMML